MESSPAVSRPPQQQQGQLWADKYRPQTIEQMCYPVCTNRLKQWVASFPSATAGNPKAPRGALLSGPPGVGKTTSVYLVAKALNLQVIEYNASDFRSKKSLHEGVASVVNNRVFSADGRRRETEAVDTKFLLLMDEVDGCDIGGVAEVIAMIKKTKIPIICTCNDRWHQKLRSLVNYVEDIRFSRPPCNIVANFICEKILAREGVSLSKQILQDIIKNSGSDIRNTLNNLQIWSLKRNVLDQKQLAQCASGSYKNGDVGLFDAAELFLLQGSSTGAGPQSVSTLLQAYYNADLVDLFVQENYLHFQSSAPNKDWLTAVTQAASSLSTADTYQRVMYIEQNWLVSNAYIVASTITPCAAVRGHYQSFASGQAAFFDRQRPVKFPSWLGNNSSAGKNDRLLTMLAKEAGNPVSGMSGTKSDVALDYLPMAVVPKLTRPMVEREKEGIAEVISVMDQYHLSRDDWDFSQEVIKFKRMEHMASISDAKTAAAMIPTVVKSAFTREFNKTHKMDNFARSALKHTGTGAEEAPAEYDDADGAEASQNAGDDDDDNGDGELLLSDAANVTPTSSLITTKTKATEAKAPARGRAAAGKGPSTAPAGAKQPKAPAAAAGKKKAPAKRPLTFIDADDV